MRKEGEEKEAHIGSPMKLDRKIIDFGNEYLLQLFNAYI